MRYQGKLIIWMDDKGFGFVVQNGGTEQIFVHIREFTSRRRRPVVNEIISFEIATDAQGRKQARNVSLVGTVSSATNPAKTGNFTLILAAAFLVFVCVAAALGRLPIAVPGLYLAASIIAYFAYALDKSAARHGAWRTPESTLHLLGLIGGWPGALLAQKKLRHKNRKASFQAVFWMTVAINCGGLGWAMTPGGAELLHELHVAA